MFRLSSETALIYRFPFLTLLATCLALPVYSQEVSQDEPAAAESSSRSQSSPEFVPGRVLVLMDPALDEAEGERIVAAQRGRTVSSDSRLGLRIVELPPGANEAAAVRAFRAQRGVLAAELDEIVPHSQVTPNDPLFSSQAHLKAIKGPAAWVRTTGSSAIIVAVIDTGVNGDHPDLAGRLVPGWNTYENNANSADVYGHGTKVAGTITTATNNGVGVASICWDCMIMPIRASQPNGSASYSAIAAGLTWASDRGARVANMSYMVTTSSVVTAAAKYFMDRGGLVFASAGNYSTNDTSADNPHIVTVSAVDPATNALYSWSNYGNNIDVTAPGCAGMTILMNLTYGSGCGTSYSSPIAAGVAALIFSANPSLSPAEALAILKQTAVDLGPAGWDNKFGAGMVDADRAVARALSTAGPDTKGPAVTIVSPASGAVIKGAFAATATAVDAEGAVASVVFKLGSSTVCSFISGPYSCSIDSTKSPDGATTFAVVAVDSAGNSTTVQQPVTIENADTIKPVVSLVSPSPAAVVSGTVAINFSATDNTGVAGIVVTAGSTVICTLPGSATSCSWDTTKFQNGNVVLTVTARDAANNSQAVSITVSVQNSDTQPPSVSLLAPAEGATVSGTVTISFTVADNAGVTSTTVKAGSATLCSVAGPASSCSWNTLSMANGPVTVSVAARDAAGNSKEVAVNVSVFNADTVKPVVSILAPVQGATVSGSVNIAFTATDNVAVTSLKVTAGAATLCTFSGPASSCTWNTSLVANGPYTITVTAGDAAGNTQSASAGVTVNNLDTQKPTLAILSPAEGATVSGSTAITFSASDNVGVTGITVTAGGATICSLTGTANSCTWNTALVANGAYILAVSARDAAGNTTAVTRNVTVNNADKTAPTVAINAPASGAQVSGMVAIQFAASDNVGVTGVTVTAAGATICTLAGTATSCQWDTAKTANGTVTISVTARDAAGNTASAGRSVTVNNPIADQIKPTVAITSPAGGSIVSGSVSVTASATDNVKVTKLVLAANGNILCTLTAASGTCIWNTAAYPNGGNTLTATAYDAANNAGVAQAVVTVANGDTIKPVVSFVSVSPQASQLAGQVTVNVASSDNIGVANVMVSANGKPICNLPGGNASCVWSTDTFPNGSYTLVATALDNAGNSSSASMMVSLLNPVATATTDRIKPMAVITSPGAGAVLKGQAAISYAAYDDKAVTKVIVRLNTITLCNMTSAMGACVIDTTRFADGLYNIVAVAYDAAGNGSLGYIQARIANTSNPADAQQVLEEPTLDELDEDVPVNPEPDSELEPAPEPAPGEPPAE